MSQIGPILANAALEAVAALMNSELSNDEKRASAFATILETLARQGISVAASVINAAIEAAVLKIKSETPTT